MDTPIFQNYCKLAEQERVKTHYALLEKLIIFFKSLINPNDPQFSPLEQLLIDDEETLPNPLTSKFAAYTQIEGYEVHYVRIPPKSNKPYYVFVHGLGGNLQEFDQLFDKLYEEGYGILAFDQPGYGKSNSSHSVYSAVPMKVRLTLDFLTNVTANLIQQLKIEDYYLVGHSYGSQISTNLILRKDSYIGLPTPSKIWLLTPVAYPTPTLPLLLRFKFFLHYYFPFIWNYNRKIGRLGNIERGGVNYVVKLKDTVDPKFADFVYLKHFRLNLSVNGANVANQLYNRTDYTFEQLQDFKNALTQKNIKLSLIDGKLDIVTKNGGEIIYKNLNYEKSTYKLLNGGHCIQVDHPEEILESLLFD